jgi:hypothetical protein
MNIGYYTSSLGQTELNLRMFDFLNKAIENNEIDNGSVFYEDIAYNPLNMKVGLFNSTDIWYFTGTLLVSGYRQVETIKKVINKFDACYVYDGDRSNLLALISVCQGMKVITTSEEDFNYVKRVCGKDTFLVEEFTVEKIREIYNEQVAEVN